MEKNYLESVLKQFHYNKLLGERTFDQLTDDELTWQYNIESNSISIIVKHLWGNMMSRWTDFLNSDGEKTWRDREAEFEGRLSTRQEILDKWDEGWACLFDALNNINKENIHHTIYIRNMGHTVTEAINRQLAHYSNHIGQIIYIGRMIKGSEWKSLSIPKGGSKEYNKSKFEKPKHQEHFTEEFLKKK